MPGPARGLASRRLCTGKRQPAPPNRRPSRGPILALNSAAAAAAAVGVLAGATTAGAGAQARLDTAPVIGVTAPALSPTSPQPLAGGQQARPSGPPALRPSIPRGTLAQAGNCADAHLLPTPGNLRRAAAATLCLINAERSAAGLAPLRNSVRLARAARGHSQDMTARGYFDHTTPDGESLLARLAAAGFRLRSEGYSAGENIAWGTGRDATPAAAVALWMNSAGHRANILRGSFRLSGIGLSASVPDRSLAGVPGATYTEDFAG